MQTLLESETLKHDLRQDLRDAIEEAMTRAKNQAGGDVDSVENVRASIFVLFSKMEHFSIRARAIEKAVRLSQIQ